MRITYPFIAICCLALVGCKKGDDTSADNGTAAAPAASTPATTTAAKEGDVTGKWSGTAEPGGVKLTYDIKADSLTQTSESTMAGSTAPITTVMEATYKIDGKKMSVKATKMQLATEDPKLKPEFEKSNAVITPEYLDKQPAQEWTLEWKDKDTLAITSHNGQNTLTATVKRQGDAAGTAAPESGGKTTG
jgi:hypothetical protein